MNISSFTSANGICHGNITTDGWNIKVDGMCKIDAPTVRYAASAPPDIRASYMGSGLPFPNEEVAYEGSSNVGEVPCSSGKFSFRLVNPNSYYKSNGTILVNPHVMFTIGDQYFDVPIPTTTIAGRSLTSMAGRPNRVIGR